MMTNSAVWNVNSISNGLEDKDDGINFPGQCQSKVKKEKASCLAKLRNFDLAS